jgi:uric acid transporter
LERRYSDALVDLQKASKLGEICNKPVDEKALVRGLRVDGLATVIGGLFNSFPHSQNIGLGGVTGARTLGVRGGWRDSRAVRPDSQDVDSGGLGSATLPLSLLTVVRRSFLCRHLLQIRIGRRWCRHVRRGDGNWHQDSRQGRYSNNRYNLYIVAISIGMAMIPVVSNNFSAKCPSNWTRCCTATFCWPPFRQWC